MEGAHELNQIYIEIRGDTWHLADLWRLAKDAGLGSQHVVTLLKVANNDLPELEYEYLMLKNEINSLQKQKSDLYNQVTIQSNELEYYRVQCQRQKADFNYLQQRTKKAEALATRFDKNNQEYIKIRKTAIETVRSTLSNGK